MIKAMLFGLTIWAYPLITVVHAQPTFWMESTLYEKLPVGYRSQYTVKYAMERLRPGDYNIKVYAEGDDKPFAEKLIGMPESKMDPLQYVGTSNAISSVLGEGERIGDYAEAGMNRRLVFGVFEHTTSLKREIRIEGNCAHVFEEFNKYPWFFHVAVKISEVANCGGFEVAPFAAFSMRSRFEGDIVVYDATLNTLQERGYWKKRHPGAFTPESVVRTLRSRGPK